MTDLILSEDQQAAETAFVQFITDPNETVWLLEGYAGTGKSTLVNHLLNALPATLQTVKLITCKDTDFEVVLTATTNKACEALAEITNQEVRTIQSFLGLRVEVDYRARPSTSKLVPKANNDVKENCVIVIDEASFVDTELLAYIFKFTKNCKIMFIGDPAQLAPPKTGLTPVFSAGFKTSRLTKVMRQAEGNPIIDLATGFRNTVNGMPWPSAKMDGQNLIHLPRADFEAAILQEFSRPDAIHNMAKVLAYTNKTVIPYNHGIREHIQGVPELEVGDYAICNSYVGNKQCNIKTDQTVMITAIHNSVAYGVKGWAVTMDNKHQAFLPRSLEDKKQRIAQARAEGDHGIIQHIDTHWIDLRAAFACTINKSQGSTYDRVFIDLDDVRTCKQPNNMARLMYVAVSRARYQVVMTGDLVDRQRAAA